MVRKMDKYFRKIMKPDGTRFNEKVSAMDPLVRITDSCFQDVVINWRLTSAGQKLFIQKGGPQSTKSNSKSNSISTAPEVRIELCFLAVRGSSSAVVSLRILERLEDSALMYTLCSSYLWYHFHPKHKTLGYLSRSV